MTSVKPGAFKTSIESALKLLPQHPAYADPSTVTSMVRKSFTEGLNEDDDLCRFGFSDPVKGVEKVWELTRLENPPYHLPLGKDSLKFLKDKGEELTKAVEGYASWSDGLQCA